MRGPGDNCRCRMRGLNLTMIFFFLIIISLSGVYRLSGQEIIVPSSPRLERVTVDPATGYAILNWLPSSSPGVKRYIIYTYSDGTGTAIDTVSSSVTAYTHTTSAARYRSESYVVAAMDSAKNTSPLSNSLNTIWLEADEDICQGNITAIWTPYGNQYHPATGCKLNVTTRAGGALYEIPVPVEERETSFAATLIPGYESGREYCFHITVTGTGSISTSSNRVCLVVGSSLPPEWVRIDAVSVEDKGLTVYGSCDQEHDIPDFKLFEYDYSDLSWKEAATTSEVSGRVIFSHFPVDTTVVNLYRIAAVNICNNPVTVSNQVSNMVLTHEIVSTVITLRWNRPRNTESELFTVWRDSGEGWQVTAHSISDTLWSDNYALLSAGISHPAIKYRITAADPSVSGYGTIHQSSVTTAEISVSITVPNAFTPGSNDENARFRPVLSFIPAVYDLRVYSRSGSLLFHSSDYEEGWDGREQGVMMTPGVCLWSLKLTTPSGEIMTRKGTVTLLP